jgi:hypothetical protein
LLEFWQDGYPLLEWRGSIAAGNKVPVASRFDLFLGVTIRLTEIIATLYGKWYHLYLIIITKKLPNASQEKKLFKMSA